MKQHYHVMMLEPRYSGIGILSIRTANGADTVRLSKLIEPEVNSAGLSVSLPAVGSRKDTVHSVVVSS